MQSTPPQRTAVWCKAARSLQDITLEQAAETGLRAGVSVARFLTVKRGCIVGCSRVTARLGSNIEWYRGALAFASKFEAKAFFIAFSIL
jgi:hypothetical protein